jgi:WS/DGAT/MGAT family acyltransferase
VERLSGLDAAFLYLETEDAHMHVAMVGIYDVSTMRDGYSFERLRQHIAERLHVVPPFRRRLVEVPFQFHHPVWLEDPEFDLDHHVRRIHCPAPGGRRELAQVASEITSVPLDRSRPLWEAWVIEGLKHDRVGFVVKVHHAAIDGASGAEIMTALYDLSPDSAPVEPVEVPPERVPNELELLSYATVSKLRRTWEVVPLLGRTVGSAVTLVRNIRNPQKPHGGVPLTAPRTPFNRSIGPKRAVSFARVPLDETRAIKEALGVKVNDVILAICAGTLRRYLQSLDALPPDPLLAVCPVSVRIESERDSQGNKVSAMFAQLPTQLEDPRERLDAIRASTEGAKEDHNAIGARTLTDWAEWAAPRTFGLASRLYSAMNLADAHRPIHNLVVSNVPGPPFPLYLAGAELVAAYPMGPIMDGAGLNITVLSYRNHIDIGFLADAELVPDVWDVAGMVQPAFEELRQLAGLIDPTITKPPAPVTRVGGRRTRRAAAPRKGGGRRRGTSGVDERSVRRDGVGRHIAERARHRLTVDDTALHRFTRRGRSLPLRHVGGGVGTCSSFRGVAYNLADLFEHTVDAVGDRIAVVDGDVRLSYRELDERGNRVGHFLASRGVGKDDHVGIYAQNSHQWLEAMLGCLKIRAVPINVNYRYVTDELSYLIGNAELVACIYDQEYADRLTAVADRSPKLTTFVHIEDDSGADTSSLDSVPFEEAAAAGGPERDFPERSDDDIYVIYTGGTTGMPKGVMWRHEDIFFALGQGIDALTGERVADEYTKAQQAAASETPLVFCVIPPLMHGAAQIATLSQWFIGSTLVLIRKFDAEGVWDTFEREGVNSVIITGDAMARPLMDALEANPGRWDLSALISLSSSAALFSQSLKDRYLEHFPNLIITDSIGSTESGFNGITYAAKGAKAAAGGPTVTPGRDVVILDEHLEVIPPGDERIGRLGRGGNIPLGYFNDPVKSAENFVVAADGRRYAVSGDSAQWTADGRMTMLGRGSVSINTGGEKVFPEEVEQALKAHPAVFDCTVVGVPDERWGQRVAAVVQFTEGRSCTLEDLDAHARQHIAGYKVPRELHVVDRIVRSPSGKPDYRWAKHLAENGTAG